MKGVEGKRAKKKSVEKIPDVSGDAVAEPGAEVVEAQSRLDNFKRSLEKGGTAAGDEAALKLLEKNLARAKKDELKKSTRRLERPKEDVSEETSVALEEISEGFKEAQIKVQRLKDAMRLKTRERKAQMTEDEIRLVERIKRLEKELKTQAEREKFLQKVWLHTFGRETLKEEKKLETLSDLLEVIEKVRAEMKEQTGKEDVPDMPDHVDLGPVTSAEKHGVLATIRGLDTVMQSLTVAAGGYFLYESLTKSTDEPFSAPHLTVFGVGLTAIPAFEYLRKLAFFGRAADSGLHKETHTQLLGRAFFIAMVGAAMAPTLTTTAAAFVSGEHAGTLAKDMSDALDGIKEQLEQMERSSNGTPTRVDAFFKTIHEKFEKIVVLERDGGKEEGSGGTGSAGYGPSTAGKDYLLFGSFEHLREEDKKNFSASTAASVEAWAKAKRAALGIEGSNSVEEQVNGYYENFLAKAEEKLETLAKQDAEARKITTTIEEQSNPLIVKLNLLRAYVLSIGGVESSKDKIIATLLEIQELQKTEFVDKSNTLIQGVADALEERAASTEGKIVIEAPLVQISVEELKKVTAPEQVNYFGPEAIEELIRSGSPISQGVYAFILALLILSASTPERAARIRSKYQGNRLALAEPEVFGDESYREGTLHSLSYGLAESYHAYFVENKETSLLRPEVRRMLPFGGDMAWADFSPSFMTFLLHKSAEQESGAAKNPEKEGLVKGLVHGYGEMLKSLFERGSQAPEVGAYAAIANLANSNREILLALDSAFMPGFSQIKDLRLKLESAERQGNRESAEKLSRQYEAAFMDMVLGHLLSRLEYSKVRLETYTRLYDTLKDDGSLDELYLGATEDLPRVSIPLLDNSFNLEENEATLVGIGGTVARNVTVSVLEKHFAEEKQLHAEIETFLKGLDEKATEKILANQQEGGVFFEKVRKVHDSLKEARSVVVRPSSERVRRFTSYGAAERMLTEQTKDAITERLAGTEVLNDPQFLEQMTRGIGVKEKIQKLKEEMTAYAVTNRFFANDAVLQGYECIPSIEFRPKGFKGSIVDYYALVYQIQSKEGKTVVYETEFPLREEFSPLERRAEAKIGNASLLMRNNFSMEAFLDATKKSIETYGTQPPVPERIELASPQAEGDLNELFENTLPAKKIAQARRVAGRVKKLEEGYRALMQESVEQRNASSEELFAISSKIQPYLEGVRKAQDDLERISRLTYTPLPEQQVAARVVGLFRSLGVNAGNLKIRLSYTTQSGKLELEDKTILGRFRSKQKRTVEVQPSDVLRAIENVIDIGEARRALIALTK